MPESTTKPTTLEGELVDHEETAIARQDGAFAGTALAFRTDGERTLERYGSLLAAARKIAIKATGPADWVRMRPADASSPETLLLRDSGGDKVAPVFGLGMRALPGMTLEPQASRPNGILTYTLRCAGFSALLGSECEVEAVRNELEPFTGRQVDDDGRFVKKDGKAYPPDLKNSTRSLAMKKIVVELCGLKNVTTDEVGAIWADAEKVRQIAGGHGFGSADGRRAQGVAEAGAQGGSEALWQELLRRTGGDTSAASSLLRDITANPPKFTGFTDPKRLTLDWQIDNARKKLAKHPIFGDGAKVQTEGADREPGEDG